MKPGLPLLMGGLVLGMAFFGAAFYVGMIQKQGNLKPVAEEKEDVPLSPEEADPLHHPISHFTGVAEEMDKWKEQLAAKEKKLLAMDAELLRREKELEALVKSQSDSILKAKAELEEMKQQYLFIESQEQTRLQESADLISTMKPDGSVAILREMPNNDIAKLLTKMKSKSASKILQSWSTAHKQDLPRLAEVMTILRKVSEKPEGYNSKQVKEPGKGSPEKNHIEGAKAERPPRANRYDTLNDSNDTFPAPPVAPLPLPKRTTKAESDANPSPTPLPLPASNNNKQVTEADPSPSAKTDTAKVDSKPNGIRY